MLITLFRLPGLKLKKLILIWNQIGLKVECPGLHKSSQFDRCDLTFYLSMQVKFKSHSGLDEHNWSKEIHTRGLVKVLQVLNSLCILPFES